MKQTSEIEQTIAAQAPFHVVNDNGPAPVLIICDHASGHVPPEYGNLGLSAHHLTRHIAWDIGAGDVSRRLAALLEAPAVLCGTSRLVIDCNRPFAADSSIPASSDGVAIPANATIDEGERQRRIDRYFRPYHDEISHRIQSHLRHDRRPALISIHSFTPRMNGFHRPWHVGMLWDQDQRLAAPVIRRLRRDRKLMVGENEPYDGSNPPGYALHAHAADNGVPIAVFEIRQDLIETEQGANRWAQILAAALRPVLADYGRDQSMV
ncbi:MAG: N-formylglutamate amidohydrolase [Proteobacteria bacterium]|nr:N-formylglutamate amidohydrolase [Pseudomonadota bacterium]